MSNVMAFHFGDKPVRIDLDEHGEPWWIAKDVCAILAIRNVSNAVGRLAAGEKSVRLTDNALIINESGLYRLIFRSDKAEAKAFQAWVFGEVLPAIRKTGKYEAAPILDRHPDLKAITELAVGLAEARDIAAQAQAVAHAAEVKAARAEGKADIALDDRRMTIEEFVLRNGLLPQHPPATWKSIALWLTRFCLDYNLRVEKSPVVGKLWPDEWSYPLQAFGRWLDYEKRKPKQTHLHIVESEGGK